jgi:hypothetical protein
MKSKRNKNNSAPILIGQGLDNKDGHQRITKAEEILIVGGSPETHEKMQEQAIKFSEESAKKGKKLSELSLNELSNVVQTVISKT